MKRFFALALAATLCTPALAVDPGMYAGLDVGRTRIDGIGSASGIGGFLGYNVNTNFGVEASYRRLGSFLGLDTSATQISVLGHLPLSGGLGLYGRLGYNTLRVSGAGSDSGALYGLGMRYEFNKSVALRTEYSRVASDTAQWNLGVEVKF